MTLYTASCGDVLSVWDGSDNDYDQVARNIACLAQLVMNGKNDKGIAGCRFIVICPRPQRSSDYNDKVFDSLNRNWEDALKKLGVFGTLGDSFAKIEKYHKNEIELLRISKEISERSVVISWEAIIDSLKDKDLKNFYGSVLKENGLYKGANP